MITTLIFDMDGLLADSEPLQARAYQQALQAFGVTITEEEYARHWIRDGLGIQQFVESRKLPLAAGDVRREKAQIYQRLVKTSLRPMPGAEEVLARLSRRYRLALASGSKRADIMLVLERLGFTGCFEVIAAHEDIARGKPAPDIFLFAAERMGVKPEECLVVEDAEKGILAAQRAGMLSVAIPNALTRENDFSAATYVVGSLWEVEKTLEAVK